MSDLEKAIEVLKQGGIVIFPTDTAFGIGCKLTDENAAKRLFKLRKRPLHQAVPVLFESIEQVSQYVLPIEEKVRELMDKNWPGALTIVLPCDDSKIPSLVRGNGKTLGVRIPDHDIVLSLIRGVGVPILGPSANFNGEKTPYNFEALDKTLIKLVDFVLEGNTKGEGLASTVVDCTVAPWKIIRQGEVVLDL